MLFLYGADVIRYPQFFATRTGQGNGIVPTSMPPRIPIARKNKIICTTINKFSPRLVSFISTPHVHSCYTLLLPFYARGLASHARKRTQATHTPNNGYGAQKGAQ